MGLLAHAAQARTPIATRRIMARCHPCCRLISLPNDTAARRSGWVQSRRLPWFGRFNPPGRRSSRDSRRRPIRRRAGGAKWSPAVHQSPFHSTAPLSGARGGAAGKRLPDGVRTTTWAPSVSEMVNPPSWTRRWWKLQSRSRLSSEVRPPWSQCLMWWPWTKRWLAQPGKRQPLSRSHSARLIAVGMARVRRPTSSTPARSSTTAATRPPSHATRRNVSAETCVPSSSDAASAPSVRRGPYPNG